MAVIKGTCGRLPLTNLNRSRGITSSAVSSIVEAAGHGPWLPRTRPSRTSDDRRGQALLCGSRKDAIKMFFKNVCDWSGGHRLRGS